jgi:hypothetical protein
VNLCSVVRRIRPVVSALAVLLLTPCVQTTRDEYFGDVGTTFVYASELDLANAAQVQDYADLHGRLQRLPFVQHVESWYPAFHNFTVANSAGGSGGGGEGGGGMAQFSIWWASAGALQFRKDFVFSSSGTAAAGAVSAATRIRHCRFKLKVVTANRMQAIADMDATRAVFAFAGGGGLDAFPFSNNYLSAERCL